MTENASIRIAWDMHVLGQGESLGIKTGVYRVCDEILPRLARRPEFSVSVTFMPPAFEEGARQYLRKKGLPLPWLPPEPLAPCREADVLFLPFFPAWHPWRKDTGVLKVLIAYDLIALLQPEYFEPAVQGVLRDIYQSIDSDTLVFAISEHTKRDILAYRPDIAPEQVIVIPLAAGDQFYPCNDAAKHRATRARYSIPEGVPYILSLATLEVRKNMEAVIKGFAVFLDRHPDSSLHLVLAGMKGWKLEKLNETLAAYAHVKDRVVLTGFVADEDLASLYSGAQCFLYMSHYEGFGLPPLEAMACGTPVVASNSSSLPEVVGEAGIMLDPDDIDGIADSLQKILSSTKVREDMRRGVLQRASQFCWDTCMDIIANSICRAVAKKIKLSIITICYNEKNIENTCLSVSRQTWKDFEWIVVDGGSTDGTLDILEKYKECISVFISEPDKGRYDAMNKGILRAKGEYLLFLNGGDYLANEKVLERIFDHTSIPGLEKYTTLNFDVDILYGQVEAEENGMMPWPIWTVGPQIFDLDFFSCHSLPHQATFIKRGMFKEIGLYDDKLKFSADYEWFMRAFLKHGATSQYIPMTVTVYNFAGISSSAAEGDAPHMVETGTVYEKYQSARLQAACKNLPRVSLRRYLPECIKRPLRPFWHRLKRLTRQKSGPTA